MTAPRTLALTVFALAACKAPDATSTTELARLTAQLRALETQAQESSDAAAVTPTMLPVAQQRYALLYESLRLETGEAEKNFLTREEVAALPLEVQPFAERYLDALGRLQPLVKDRDDGQAEILWTFRDQGLRPYRMHFGTVETPRVTETSNALVEGIAVRSHLVVRRVAVLGKPKNLERPGTMRLLVGLLKFSDTASEPYTPAYATASAFTNSNSTRALYEEMSNGNSTVTGDLFGWETMDMTNANCDLIELESEFIVFAAKNGFSSAGYTSYVIAFPASNNANCGGASGYGSLGGAPADVFLNNNGFGSLGHELGHNIGLEHAHGFNNCAAGTWYGTANCNTVEYGHIGDLMGSGGGHFTPFHKERLGWLDTAGMPQMTDVTTSGTYAIEPMAAPTLGVKGLKILRPADSTATAQRYYYLEFRQQVGFDVNVDQSSTTGVAINVNTSNTTDYLLDMGRTTSTKADAVLNPGNSYTDSANGITIQTVSASSSGASVQITITPPVGSCVKAAPALSLAATNTIARGAGERKTYTLSVTNNNTACGPQSFLVTSAGLPSGWTFVAGPTQVLMTDGATATSFLEITSSATASAASYPFTLTATNQADAANAGSVAGNDVVTTCVRANPTVTPTPTSKTGVAGDTVTFSFAIKNNSAGNCGSTQFELDDFGEVGWSTSVTGGIVTLAPGATSTQTLTVHIPSTATAGLHTAVVEARNTSGERIYGTGGATIDVLPCTRNVPTLTSVPTSQLGGPGQGRAYTLTLTSNDTAQCTARTFTFSQTAPGAGWTGSFSLGTLSLLPGEAKTSVYTLTSPSTATAGTSTATVKAQQSSTFATLDLDFVVGCAVATPTVTLTPASQSGVAGLSRTYSVTVKNNDSALCPDGVFNLAATAPASGWTAVPSVATLTIAQGATGTATVTLTADGAATAGNYTSTVSAGNVTSGTGSAIATYAVASCARNVPTVSLSPASQSSGAGGLRTYAVTVINNDAALCGPSTFALAGTVPASWSKSLGVGSLTLDPGAAGTTTFNVTSITIAAINTYSVSVSATSAASGTNSGTASYDVVACTRNNPTVSLTPSTQGGSGGITRVYTFSVTNNDTSNCGASVFALSRTNLTNWTQQLSPNSLNIAPGATEKVLFFVTPPTPVPPSTTLNVTANGDASGTASTTALYTSIPSPCGRVVPVVSVSPGAQSGTPGTGKTYTLTVTNKDATPCGAGTFNFSALVPTGWTGSYSPTSLSLAANGGSGSSTFTLTPPAGTSLGTYNAQLWAESASSGVDHSTVNYTVTCPHAVPTVSMAPSPQSALAGGVLSWDVTVTNNDDATCAVNNFALSATVPGGWSSDLLATTLALTPAASTTTQVTITSSAVAALGTYPVQVAATSASGGAASGNGSYVVLCSRAAPEVVITPAVLTGGAGDTLAYTVSVTNHDAANCGNATFALTPTVPSGWSGNFTSASLQVAPGATGTTTFNVSSAASEVPGVFPISATAANAASGSGVGNAQLTVAPCARATPTLTISPQSQTGYGGLARVYSLTVHDNDQYCAAGTFDLSTGLQPGWGVQLSAAQVTVASGSTGTATLTLTPPIDDSSGVVDTDVTASNVASGSITEVARYVVAPCPRAVPLVAVTPGAQSADAGVPLSYSVTVTNQDLGCLPSAFSFSSTVPGGWSGGFSVPSVTVAPGAFGTATFTLTSAVSAGPGAYNATVAADSVMSGQGTAQATYLIGCTRAPPQLVATPSSQQADAGQTLTYGYTLTNTDQATCGTGNFALTIASPSGFTGAVTTPVAVAPGAQAAGTFTLTAPANAAGGSYLSTLSAAENGSTAGSVQVAFVVPAIPDAGAPDSGTSDAGTPDAGAADGGAPDAGNEPPDAGSEPPDAGGDTDTPDGGTVTPPPSGCGCSDAGGSTSALAFALLCVLARRKAGLSPAPRRRTM